MLTFWKTDCPSIKSSEAKKWESRTDCGCRAHCLASSRYSGSNALESCSACDVDATLQGATHRHGMHLNCGLSAVKTMETE